MVATKKAKRRAPVAGEPLFPMKDQPIGSAARPWRPPFVFMIGPVTMVCSLPFELWQVGSPEEVLRIANSNAPIRFAELAATVSAAAEQGDPTAQTITMRAGKELAALAGAVMARLWPPGAVVRVAMTGGVLQSSNPVRRAFQEAIQAEYPKAALSFAYVRPVL